MKDTLYMLLNNCTVKKPDAEPLNEQEINIIMKRIKNEIHSGNNKPQRRKKSKIAFLIAAAVIACISTSVVTAKRLGVFDKLTHKKDRTIEYFGQKLEVDKFDVKYDYEQIADNAVDVSEIIKGEGDNLCVQVDEVYCDGCTTLISLSGSLKDGNPDNKQFLRLCNMTVTINGKTYTQNYSTPCLYGTLILDEGTDNQFSGDIKLVEFGENEITQAGTVEFTIESVSEQYSYVNNPVMDNNSSGFTLSVPLTPDHSMRYNDTPYTITDGDYSIRFYDISPAMMIVGYTIPDPEYADSKYAGGLFYDNDEWEWVETLQLYPAPDYGDGYDITCLVPVTSGTLKARFFDTCGHTDIVIKKEFAVNMDEVYESMKKQS